MMPRAPSGPMQTESSTHKHSAEAGSPKSSHFREVMQGIFGTGQEMEINFGLLLYLIGKRPAEGKKVHLRSFEACAVFMDLCPQVLLL